MSQSPRTPRGIALTGIHRTVRCAIKLSQSELQADRHSMRPHVSVGRGRGISNKSTHQPRNRAATRKSCLTPSVVQQQLCQAVNTKPCALACTLRALRLRSNGAPRGSVLVRRSSAEACLGSESRNSVTCFDFLPCQSHHCAQCMYAVKNARASQARVHACEGPHAHRVQTC
jgi:hypothetical protein